MHLRRLLEALKKCHQCVEACPERVLTIKDGRLQVDQERCPICEQRACLIACPARALTLCGRWLTAEEVMRKVHQDVRYYRGKGGVTLSGGELLRGRSDLVGDYSTSSFKRLPSGKDTTWAFLSPCWGNKHGLPTC